MAGYKIEFYPERCVGCQACVAACMAQKDIDPVRGEHPVCRILEQEKCVWKRHTEQETLLISEAESGERILLTWERKACRHCQEPACASVCPGGGFWKDERTGFVLYDKSRCVACGQCIKACEVQAISFDRDHVIQKCDGCQERVLAGLKPACAEVCAWGALQLIPVYNIEEKEE